MMTGFPLTMASWGTMLGIARMGAARACANFGFTGALCGSLPSARIASSSSFCKHKHPHLIFMTACLYNEAQYQHPHSVAASGVCRAWYMVECQARSRGYAGTAHA